MRKKRVSDEKSEVVIFPFADYDASVLRFIVVNMDFKTASKCILCLLNTIVQVRKDGALHAYYRLD
jgi:hypothetical protein